MVDRIDGDFCSDVDCFIPAATCEGPCWNACHPLKACGEVERRETREG